MRPPRGFALWPHAHHQRPESILASQYDCVYGERCDNGVDKACDTESGVVNCLPWQVSPRQHSCRTLSLSFSPSPPNQVPYKSMFDLATNTLHPVRV